ncbi:MAG: pentapeptide repeat-containing protein [Bacteroidota bacterium]|nr:pentapeptide repeat-containing protein [Bacteroidota bacterium]MDP4233434.1 pentapeptide repeat-containing protein [Bacteroidota bacterium]MDP4242300.1 pentapeptide repeat-containing protein [Bacteroidota bacterium]MDP4287056.1 pentapeptide repeat-containing protein [Bacteroidota bacterium]
MRLYEKQEFEDIRGNEFEGATFRQCELIGTDARDAKFIGCTFEGSTLSSVKVDGAVIQAHFVNSKIEGINFFTAKRELLLLSFTNCLIRYSSFAELKLKKIKINGCTLQFVDFADADLTEANFENSSFEDCTFRNTNLTKADFRTARGYSVDPRINTIKGAHFDLPEVLGLLDAFDIEIG